MSNTYAVLDQTGLCVDVVISDPVASHLFAPDGGSVEEIPVQPGSPGIGWTFVSGIWSPPVP